MGAADQLGKQVRCPFYHSTTTARRFIHCEGQDEGNRLCVTFETEDAYLRQWSMCCSKVGRYKDCPIYIGLMKTKYDLDEDSK